MDDLSPDTSVCWALTRTAAYVEGALRECDLTSRQYRMLVAIAQGPLSATALAGRIGVAPPSATIMVRGLIQRGAVRREVSTEDQRRIWLSVTDEGRALLAQAEASTRARLAQIAEHFTDAAQGRLAIEMLAAWNPALDQFRAGWLETHRHQPDDPDAPPGARTAPGGTGRDGAPEATQAGGAGPRDRAAARTKSIKSST